MIRLCATSVGLAGCLSAFAQPVVSLSGGFSNQNYTITYTDGSYDKISVNATANLVFNAPQPTCNNTNLINSSSQVSGSIRVWGSAVQYPNQTYTSHFDNTYNFGGGSLPVSISYEGQTGAGKVQTLQWKVPLALDSNNATPFEVDFFGNTNGLQLWIQLPQPFVYPTSDEFYDGGAVPVVSGQSSVQSCLNGLVIDSDGKALPGAHVSFGGVATTTGTSGMFYYGGIPANMYQLVVTNSGYVPYTNILDIPAFRALKETVALQGALGLDGYVFEFTSNGIADSGILITLQSTTFTRTTTTDENGHYAFSGLAPGAYTITPRSPGRAFLPLSQMLEIESDTNAQPFVDVGNSLAVTGMTDGYAGEQYFLDGVSFPVTFTANVDWGGNPPWEVRFMHGTTTIPVSANGSSASYTFDMGSNFGPGGQLQVMAVSTDGAESKGVLAPFTVMPAIPLFTFKPNLGNVISYSMLSSGPNWDVIDAVVEPAKVPSNIPVFGGQEFNLHFVPKVEGTVEANECTVTATLEDIYEFKWASFTGDISPHIALKGEFIHGQWNWIGSAGGEFSLDGETNWIFTIYAGEIPIPGFIKVKASLAADVSFDVSNLSPPILSGEAELSAKVRGSLLFGFGELLSAGGWIEGSGQVTLQRPQDPIIKSYTVQLDAGVTVYFLLYEFNQQFYHWVYPPPVAPPLVTDSRPIARPTLIPRDYLQSQAYGHFKGRPTSQLSKHKKGAGSSLFYALQSQVFPLSQPALSSNGTNCLAAWLYDDPNRAANNRTLLVFSRFDGKQWSSFAPVFDDGTADFHPQLLSFADGTAVAAWENERIILDTNATLADMVSNLCIGAAFYNPQTGQWRASSPPITNECLAHSPKLAGQSSDSLMLVWTLNPSNDPEGSSVSPNQLWFSHWNGTTWTQPAAFAVVPYPLLKYDLQYDGMSAHLVMTLDTDNAYTNLDAHALFGISYANGAWGDLQRLTTNAVPNENPKMTVDSHGNFVLVWLQGSELSSVTNFNFAARQIIMSNADSSNLGDFRLAAGTNGQLAVVYEQPSDYSSDLWAIFYDPVFQSWGNPLQLTDDPQSEGEATAAFFGQGQLLTLYDRLDFDRSQNATGSMITNADLFVLEYQLTSDLALQTNSLQISPPNPTPGSNAIIQVTVQNLGDQAAANILVAFYLGDPATGSNLIAQTIVNGPLAAGASTVVTLEWQVPSTSVPLTVFALVDPKGSSPDANRANNEQSAIFLAPDLAVESLDWTPLTNNLLALTASVINLGTLPSSPASLALNLNSSSQTNLFQSNIPSLTAGQSMTFSFVLNASNLGEVFPVFATINTGTNLDFSSVNNAFSLTIEPNLTQATFKLGLVGLQSAGIPELTLMGLAGQAYSIQASTNLQNWTTITNLTLTNVTGQFIDPGAQSSPKRLYRARTR